MFRNNSCELKTKTFKDETGLVIELQYHMNLNSDEVEKLKIYRENYAKSSSIHFNFDGDIFLFSQKKYFKKKQLVKTPLNIEEIESNFLDEIKSTLNRYNNFLNYDRLNNLDKSQSINLNDVLER